TGLPSNSSMKARSFASRSAPVFMDLNPDILQPLVAGITAALVGIVPLAPELVVLARPDAFDGDGYGPDAYAFPAQRGAGYAPREQLHEPARPDLLRLRIEGAPEQVRPAALQFPCIGVDRFEELPVRARKRDLDRHGLAEAGLFHALHRHKLAAERIGNAAPFIAPDGLAPGAVVHAADSLGQIKLQEPRPCDMRSRQPVEI